MFSRIDEMALLVLIMTLLIPIATTSMVYSPVEAGLAPSSSIPPLLRIHHQTEVFTKAQEYLDTLRSRPACHQVAALDLVKSCKDLGDKSDVESNGDFEQIRDAAKMEFTVRLAICEMNGAQARIPKDCSRFLPSTKACHYGDRWRFGKPQIKDMDTLCYPRSDSGQVKKCLAGLWTEPQSWTSYSNAQQNAILICQATHEAREKDRLIDTLKSAAEVNGRLAAANEEAIKRQQAAQDAFDQALSMFSTISKQKVDEMAAQSGSVIDNILEAARNAVAQIYRGAAEAATSMTRLEEGLSANHAKALQLDDLLGRMHQDVKQSREEDSLVHSSQLQSVQASFEQVMLMIRQSVADELGPLRARIENITDGAVQAVASLDTFNEGLNRSQQILEQHNAFAEETYGKVQHLMAAFSGQGIFQSIGLILGLLAVHLVLKVTLGSLSATLFACVFAAVSATHLFGPAHQPYFALMGGLWTDNFTSVATHSRTLAAICFFLAIATAIMKLGVNGIVEWCQASRSPSSSAPMLPTTAPKLYNPASPPYHPSDRKQSALD